MNIKVTVKYSLLVTCVFSGIVPFLASPVLALPEQESVVAGDVVVGTPESTVLDIHQQTSSAIVQWHNFDIEHGETVNVYQPDDQSILLNRILDQDPTSILGKLNANGHVWLMNPNGVMFGGDARVNVGGLIATTSDIENQDFLSGDYHFDQRGRADAIIRNEGVLDADGGMIALLAPVVENSGTIRARLGKVVMASTDTYTVDFHGDGLMNFVLDDVNAGDEYSSSYYSVNEGDVIADAGVIEMSVAQGNAAVERVIENKWTGRIQANSVGVNQQGKIVLGGGSNGLDNNTTVLVGGTLHATGDDGTEKGGEIDILGDQVAVMNGGVIDVSGDVQAGTAHIGGEYLGKGETKTARATIIQNDSYIIADGGQGEVVVWSDEYTKFDGTISANGGGGFVETSSKEVLLATGVVQADGGLWLLDPGNIDVRDDAGGGPDDSTIAGPIFDSAGVASVVTTEAIETALTGADVTVMTSGGGGGIGVINVTDTISYTGGTERTLTFQADHDINFNNATINSTAAELNVVLWSDYNRTSLAAGTGSVVLNNSTVTTFGGDFVAGGGANPYTELVSDGVYTGNVVVSTGGGLISLRGYNSGTGSFTGGVRMAGNSSFQTTTGSIVVEGVNTNTGTDNSGVWFDNGALQTVSGAIDVSGTSTFDNTDNRGVNLILGGSNVVGSGGATAGDINITGTVASAARTAVHMSNQAFLTTGAADVSITGNTGGIYISTPLTKNNGGDASLSISADDSVVFRDDAPGTDITSSSGAWNISIQADSDGNGSGDIDFDTTDFVTNGGDFYASGQGVIIQNSTITANSGGVGNVSLVGNSLLLVGSTVTAAQDVTVRPLNVSTSINLGANTGGMDATAGELAMLNAGDRLVIGNNGSGTGGVLIDNINVSGGGYDLEVHGGEITVSNGLTAAGSIFLNAQDSNDLILNSVVTSQNSGDSLVLSASRNFLNNYGAGALDPGTGRFIVYAHNPVTSDFGGLAGLQILGHNIETLPSSSVSENGDVFVYALSSSFVNDQFLISPSVPVNITDIDNVYDIQTATDPEGGSFTDSISGTFSDFTDSFGGSYQQHNLMNGTAVLFNAGGYDVIGGSYIPSVGDFIRTGLQFGFTFESDENAIIKMTRNSSMRVKRSLFSPNGKNDTYYDVQDGAVGFFSERDQHKGEVKTILPGIAIKVSGTCYIVDHNKDKERTNITLFGGGIELYIEGSLVKLHHPIQMISFGAEGAGGAGDPVPLTMDDVREIFHDRPEIIPDREQLLKCGVPEESV